jgi:cytochrome P450
VIPRFTGPPLLGLNLRFLRDPLGMFEQARRDHGDLVELDLGVAGPLYAAFHPDGVRQVLQRGRRTHRGLLRELLGKGLFTTPSGDDWMRRRRLMQPLFHPDRLAEAVPLLRKPIVEALESRWRADRRVDLAAEMKRLTVAMMIDATFGSAPGVDKAAARNALSFLLGYVDEQLFRFPAVPRSWPTDDNRRYRRDIAVLRGVIASAMRRPGDEPTFLNGLLETRAAGEGFTDEELVDEVLSIFIAGTETTGTALTWALHLLSQHPEQHGTGAEWARAAVSEAVRLYPPAWALRRVTDEPLEINGHEVPAGARLIVSSYVTHRHPDIWDQPEQFRLDRWLAPANRPRFSYFPFGAGAHQCVGNAFALLEGELVLTEVARRFRLGPPERPLTGTKPAIALTPVPAPQPLLLPA